MSSETLIKTGTPKGVLPFPSLGGGFDSRIPLSAENQLVTKNEMKENRLK
jgi:hypothetical protein